MIMKKNTYSRLGETLYTKVLDNGLQVSVLHRPDYKETLGAIAVRFGSLDRTFRPKYRKNFRQFPSGIAHFLEHKVFEIDKGRDVMASFSALGTEVNAFTGYDQTVYYFSATSHILESLELLESFTAKLQVSQDSLDKEKEIIGQEIKMYEDDPDHQLYLGILGQLYPDSPLAEDIAGSLESIDEIEIKDLMMNFDLFYQASNMLLFLASPIDPEILMEDIERFQMARRPRKVFEIDKQSLASDLVLPSTLKEFPVSGPKLAVGVKSKSNFTRLSTSSYRVALKLFFAMILGWTSSTYQTWYDQGKIDDSFFMEIEVTKSYQFLIITLDSHEPMAMSKRIRQLLKGSSRLLDLSEDHLTLVKQEMYGDFLKSMNSLEFTVMQAVNSWINEEGLFEFPDILDQLSLDDVIYAGQDFIDHSQMTDFMIFPQ